ncbi:MAG TPA: HD domain-containing protein [Thermoplasmata archaeon]|nr:HD domain-containing protein [Thermoplasmata archaeon]
MTKKEKDKKKGDDLEFVDYIYDPIYGNVDITQIENEIIHTPEFLKLIGIKQLGLKSLVFPGALHTRFEHSIGTMDVCDDYLYHLDIDFNPKTRQIIRLCGLLHDIGHGPFSHAIEEILETRKEWVPSIDDVKEVFFNKEHKEFEEDLDSESNKILEDLDFKTHDAFSIFIILAMPFKYEKFKENKFLFEKVAKILYGKKLQDNERWKHDIIHGDIGADRIDYLSRDSHHTGISFGIVDTEQILRYIELIGNPLRDVVSLHLGNKKQDIDASYKEKISRTVGENILISRIHHYNMLVENPKAVGIEKTLYKCLYLYLKNLNNKKAKKKISEIFLDWDDNRLIQEIKNQTKNNGFIKAHFPVLKGEKQLNVLYRYDIHSFDLNLRFWLIMLEKNYRNKIEEDLEKEIKNKLNIKDTIVDLSYLSSIPELRMDGIGGVTRFFYDESYISQGAIRDQMRNLSLTIFSLKDTKEISHPKDLKDLIEEVVANCREKALKDKKDKDEFIFRYLELLKFLSAFPEYPWGIGFFYKEALLSSRLYEYYKQDFEEIGHPESFFYNHKMYSDLMRLNAIGIIHVKDEDYCCSYKRMMKDSRYKKNEEEISRHSFKYDTEEYGESWCRHTISYNILIHDFIPIESNERKELREKNFSIRLNKEIEKILDQVKEYIK